MVNSTPDKSKLQSSKWKPDEMDDGVYTIMTRLSSNVKKQDESVFREHVANTLQNLKSRWIQPGTK